MMLNISILVSTGFTQPSAFDFTPSILSGAIIGQVELDSMPCEMGSWMAAFDSAGNCAGAAELILFEGKTFINLNIYGDDPLTSADEGMEPNEDFTLQLFLPSASEFISYAFGDMPIRLSGWVNNNGAPIPGYNDQNFIFHFRSSIPLTYELTLNDPSCSDITDGMIGLEITGGNPPYNYFWNNGQTDYALENLPAGFYQCTITDASASVLVTDSILLFSPQAILAIADIKIDSCQSETGSIAVSASGGNGSYTYSWDNGLSARNIDQLSAGNYSLTVSDQVGCQESFTFEVPSSPIFEVVAVPQQISCAGRDDGGGTIFVFGNQNQYSYQWSTGELSNEIGGVSTGSYPYTVTDQYGCIWADTLTVTEPDSLSLSIEASFANEGQSNGMASAVVGGGIPPYIYSWNDENAQESPTAQNLAAGTYTLIVTDFNGCIAIDSISVPLLTSAEDIIGPAKLIINYYPNPAQEWIYVDLSSLQAGKKIIKVMTLNGQIQKTSSSSEGEQIHSIWIKDLPEATYLLLIELGMQRAAFFFHKTR